MQPPMHIRFLMIFTFVKMYGTAFPIFNILKMSNCASSGRRVLVQNGIAKLSFLSASSYLLPVPDALALVKGNAPPTPEERARRKLENDQEKYRSISDAENAGEKREVMKRSNMEANEIAEGGDVSFKTTKSGVRYKDIVVGTGSEIENGSNINMRYRVLKLGKRSYDGLSGEATLVFSFGYGEDDDKDGSFISVTVGTKKLISAVDEAIVGMKIGGKRRVLVRPDRGQGWKSIDPNCAGLIDVGIASGIPGATISKIEDCINQTLEPMPRSYGAKRRMARRFDEALIVEIEPMKLL